MPANDGSVIISTELDNKKLHKQLASLRQKIQSLDDKHEVKSGTLAALKKEAGFLAAHLDEAKAKLEALKTGPTYTPKSAIKEQERTVAAIQRQYDLADNKVIRMERDLGETARQADILRGRAGDIEKTLSGAADESSRFKSALEGAKITADGLLKRLKAMALRALVFSVAFKALNSFKNWISKVIKVNDEASGAIAKLKGALLTLVQPLVGIIIPALTAVVKALTKIVTVLAQLVSMIFGTTAKASAEAAEALYEQTDAYGEVGDAAKKAAKDTASFDEVQKLSSDSDTSSSGSAATEIKADFEMGESLSEERLQNILGLIKLIGAALLAWKLSSGFLDGMQKFLGIALAIDGAIGLIKATMDAWTNGVSMDNMLAMIGRALELTAGLALAFGKTGAGIGLVVSGAAMLVTAFKDMIDNGITLENTLLAVAGILSAGLGIAILTGSWIPLLIAAIASVLLAITNAMGYGDEMIAGLRLILEGFIDFFVGIFTGDMERAIGGIGKIFEGLKGVVGAVFDALIKLVSGFFDWLDKKTGGKIKGIIVLLKGNIVGALEWTKETLFNFIDAAKMIVEGLVIFLSGVFTGDWEKAWSGIVNVGKGAVNLLISAVEAFVNYFVTGINAIINAINTISVDIPDWVPGVGGQTLGFNIPNISKLTLPRLASGAVIPPNREFLAVLGDQKRGTNIEAPADLIAQLVRDNSGSAAMLAVLQELLRAVQAGQTIVMDGQTVARTQLPHTQRAQSQVGGRISNRRLATNG